jgi:hypothetical protein
LLRRDASSERVADILQGVDSSAGACAKFLM